MVEQSTYVLPVKTKLVNTKYQDLLMPVWDEIIIINEHFRTFANNKNVILFFEVILAIFSSVRNHISKHSKNNNNSFYYSLTYYENNCLFLIYSNFCHIKFHIILPLSY